VTKLRIHPLLKEAAAIFRARGRQVFLVGGAVRDLLLGMEPHDWDLATDAVPEEVQEMFPRVIATGIKHGTVTIRYKGRFIETTTFRTESAYSDGRRPDSVKYAATIEEDLSRRDFTMNAIAASLPSGEIVDPFGGESDIRAKIIRCVGSPAERFGEDGLRPLRGLRFVSQLGFTLDEEALAAIPGALPVSAKVAVERIREELNRIFQSPGPAGALRLAESTGLLSLLFPELACCRGVDQKGFHKFDVLDHSILACDYAAAHGCSLAVVLAALFHDIGKPLVRRMGDDGVWTFYHHEEKSARLTGDILRRFKYPNSIMEKVPHLIRMHMFFYSDEWSDAAVRRFIIRVGEENLPDLYALRLADAFATGGAAPPPDYLSPLQDRVEKVLKKSHALSLKDLAVSGIDLMAAGIPGGKGMGLILNSLLETVLEDPAQNNRETLTRIAIKLNERRQER
jgi:tRNA nucleotidyltransferase/poly(A) polymerase